jgi:uncharacterized protein (TIGR03437 family)
MATTQLSLVSPQQQQQQLQVTSLSCTPAAVTAPGTASCTVTISGSAPPAGASVSLFSTSTKVTVPAMVLVTYGQNFAMFTATVAASPSPLGATLTAGLNGSLATTQLSISNQQQQQQLEVTGLICMPAAVTGPGTAMCTVTLNAPALPGTAVSLFSNNAKVTVPSMIAVPYGQGFAAFAASVQATATPISVTLTAGLNGSTVVVELNVSSQQQQQTPQLTSLTCSPATVSGGGTASCTVTISGTAPAGGAFVTLSSDNPKVTVPPAMLVLSGQSSANFQAQVGAIFTNDSATLSAQMSGAPLTFTLQLVPGLQIGVVANAASYQPELACSAGSLASITGSGFTDGAPVTAAIRPLPLKLAGVTVEVNGTPAELLYVSGQLIHFQCPKQDLASPVNVTVTAADGKTATSKIVWNQASPGIFSADGSGRGQGMIFVAGTSRIAGAAGPQSRPVHPGESIQILATGLPLADAPDSDAPAIRSRWPISVTVGGTALKPSAATPAQDVDGLWHIRVALPADLASGAAIPVQLSVSLPDGTVLASNAVSIAIQPESSISAR